MRLLCALTERAARTPDAAAAAAGDGVELAYGELWRAPVVRVGEERS